jgi:hypothetical protein
MKPLALGLLWAALSWGQCAMCFRNAEAQTRARADAFNKGILVLAIPLTAAAGAIAWLAYSRRARTI